MKKNKTLVGISILSESFFDIKNTIKKINLSNADFIHLDVMDGVFVPNISFGYDFVKNLRPYTKKKFDVHLMIKNPLSYIENFVKSGADEISVHIESENVLKSLRLIKKSGLKCGLVINPKTKFSYVKKYLNVVDKVVVMTVEPGFGGQKFIINQLEKVAEISKMIKKSGRKVLLEVDGGVNFEMAKLSVQKGADILVVGSFIFKQKNFNAAVNKLKLI